MRDVARADRRRELHAQAQAAGVAHPASLAVAASTLEHEGWHVEAVGADSDGNPVLRLAKATRTLTRDELAARIKAERAEGRSLTGIARDLERDGIPSPHGSGDWYPSTVSRIAARG